MSLPTDSIVNPVREWLAKRLPKAIENVGKNTVLDIKARLDAPCPVFHGVKGGKHSPPGHEPYKETGALQDGVDFDLNVNQQTVIVTISSSRVGGNPDVPKFLEWGTSRMAPRPYMRPARNRLMSKAPRMLMYELGD